MKQTYQNIRSSHPTEALILKVTLVLTLGFLVVGLISHIITVKKFMLIENTFSVLSGIIQLLKDSQYFLFIIITGFSVVVPLLKITVLYQLINKKNSNSEHIQKYLHWMHLYGKWSMLDVFVVAVLVVAVKLGAIASVEMQYGLYAFAASILLTMYVTARVVSLTDKLGQQP